MGQEAASTAVLPGNGQVDSSDNPAMTRAGIGNSLFNLIPPAMVVLVTVFWAYAPEAIVKNSWSIIVAGVLTTASILALEWVRERHAGWRMNRREFVTDLYYVVLSYTAIAFFTTKLAEDPLKAAKHSLGITTEWAMHMPFLLQVALVVFLIEFGQYWMHRLMHNWTPFWLTHAPHHHITQLNAMKGAVGNPIELFLISLSVVALFDLPQAAEFCAFNILGVVSTFAHANVRADPPIWYSYIFTTIRHHSLHHTALSYEDTRCNYGNSLILLDRIFRTYKEGESSVVGQDDRKRLSIWEQTMFPVRPVMAKIAARREKQPAAAG